MWGGLVLLAAALAPPLPWGAGAGALAAAALALAAGRRWPALGAALLALGASPLAVAAARSTSPGGWLLVGGAVGLLALGRPALPRPLPWLVLAVGWTQAARCWLLGDVAPAGGPPVEAFVVDALLVAGLAAGARPVGPSLAGLGGGGLLLGALAWRAAHKPPRSAAEAQALARWELQDQALPSLVDRPELGLALVASRPGEHRVAMGLARRVGVETVLAAGWRPEGAPLDPATRLQVGRWLELRSRGGEALRLLKAGRDDPGVAWLYTLYARTQGAPPAPVPVAPPAGTPVGPGRIAAGLTLAAGEGVAIDWHADAPISLLVLVASGREGPSSLFVAADAVPPFTVALGPEAGAHRLALSLSEGPHRLRITAGAGAASVEGVEAWGSAEAVRTDPRALPP